MHLMNVHLNINCVLFLNKHKVHNQYMKDMLSKAFHRKQTTQYFSSNTLKNKKKKIKKDDLIVFDTKHLLGASYDGTDAIPLSQTATFNIKCLKWDLKDSLVIV